MRICYLGPERSEAFHHHLREMVNLGHDVYLLEIGRGFRGVPGVRRVPIIHQAKPCSDARSMLDALKSNNFLGYDTMVGRIPRYGYRLVRLIYLAAKIKRMLRIIRPDILHAHYVQNYGWLGWLSGFHPLVVTCWGGDLLEAQKGLSILDYLLTPPTLRSANAITCCSRELLIKANRFKKPTALSQLIPLGTTLSLFSPNLPSQHLRAKLGITPDAEVLFSPRASQENFNIDIILEALAQLCSKRLLVDPVLVLKDERYGDAAYCTQLRRLSERLEIQNRLRFVGRVPLEEMPAYYCMSDVVISIPNSDCVPLTFFEAIACGIPLVVSDIPISREALEYGVVAQPVPPRDVEAVANAIYRSISDQEIRAKVHTIGPEVALRHADIKMQAARISEIYNLVMKSH